MSLQSSVESIAEQKQFYQSLAIIFLVIAIALFIAAVVIFIVFKIPHSIRVLTGVGRGKEINKISTDNKKGQIRVPSGEHKAIVSWNTSALLKKKNAKSGTEETTLLSNDETQLLSDETTILSSEDQTTLLTESSNDETTILNISSENDETTVLDSSSENDDTSLLEDIGLEFETDGDIKIVGSNQKI